MQVGLNLGAVEFSCDYRISAWPWFTNRIAGAPDCDDIHMFLLHIHYCIEWNYMLWNYSFPSVELKSPNRQNRVTNNEAWKIGTSFLHPALLLRLNRKKKLSQSSHLPKHLTKNKVSMFVCHSPYRTRHKYTCILKTSWIYFQFLYFT